MANKIFISDFDGTISNQDFYKFLFNKYLPTEGPKLYNQWQKGAMTDIEFLNYIFNNINQPEDQIIQDIEKFEIDLSFIDFIDWFSKKGPCYIISAGSDYYIHRIMSKYNIEDKIKLIANPSYYSKNNLWMTPDQNADYYSPIYGIDKGKAIRQILSQYPGKSTTFFAGDSRPDLLAARIADFVFAKKDSTLINILEAEKIDFYVFKNFHDLKNIINKSIIPDTE